MCIDHHQLHQNTVTVAITLPVVSCLTQNWATKRIGHQRERYSPCISNDTVTIAGHVTEENDETLQSTGTM